MERTAGLGHLTANEWERLQEILDRFEKAWNNVGSEDAIDLKAYLPEIEDPLRSVALQELIKAELEIRWRRGQTVRIESYLSEFPELQVAGTLSPLIYEEYRVRQLYGDKPPVTAYQDRFPDDYEELQRLVQEQPMPTLGQTITPPTVGGGVVSRPEARGPVGLGAKAAKDGDMEDGTLAGRPKDGAEQSQQDTVPPVALPSGAGGYKKIKRLGSGGFGEVWRAEAPGGVPCAIKVVFRPIEHDAAQRELQSLELIKILRHPFLLATHQFSLVGGKLEIVMELADGSLRDRLKECKKAGMQGIPVSELLQYFREAAEALDYLHSEHVIHRDIKPDNILLLNKHAKVADFGLARFLESDQTASASGSGTPAYMAPEVWRRRVSEQSDQYSLAMSYIELRLDRSFSHDMVEIMLDHLERMPDLNPLPQPEQEVLKKALSKDPIKRYRSCLAFVQALEQAVRPELEGGGGPQRKPVAPSEGSPSYDTIVRRAETEGSAADPHSSPTHVGEGTRPPVGWRERVPGAAPKSAQEQQRRKALKMMLMAVTVPVVALAAFAIVKPFMNSGKPNNGNGQPSNVFLPANCKNDGDDISIVRGKKYYKHINYVFEDGTKIPFTLIPQNAALEPATFYIMVNKVSINLFRKFAKGGNKIEDNKWEDWAKDKNPEVPIMNIRAIDALHFAAWLGGDLPSQEEWDKAAGYFEPNKGNGPYSEKEPIKEKDRTQLGLYRMMNEGPMPCGTATLDISEPFKLHDMAANGQEWTRNIADFGNKRVGQPLADLDRVMLRGRTFATGEGPLTYKDLDGLIKKGSWNHLGTKPDIGFRVVIDNLP